MLKLVEFVFDEVFLFIDDFDDIDEQVINGLIELVEFGSDDLLDVDDNFLGFELLLVELDFVSEGLSEGVDGSQFVQVV